MGVPEWFDLAVEISKRPPPPPCGTKERPHLIHPDGGYCGMCGYGPFEAVKFTTMGHNAVIHIDPK
jgi:hypothetical protein